VAFTYLKVKPVKFLFYFRWSWSCRFGLGLKNLVLFTSLACVFNAYEITREYEGLEAIIRTPDTNSDRSGFSFVRNANLCRHSLTIQRCIPLNWRKRTR